MEERIVEIRAYRLEPGMFPVLERLFNETCRPMLARWKIDVVAFGASLRDPDGAFLIRAFDSLERRQTQEDAFYGSDEWRLGPREAVLACIVDYVDAVMMLDDRTIDGLRTPAA